jgi:hypothetical protein
MHLLKANEAILFHVVRLQEYLGTPPSPSYSISTSILWIPDIPKLELHILLKSEELLQCKCYEQAYEPVLNFYIFFLSANEIIMYFIQSKFIKGYKAVLLSVSEPGYKV